MSEERVIHKSRVEFFKDLGVHEKSIPLSFDFEITPRCNNDCNHCYINLPASDKTALSKELTLSEIENIVGQAVDLGSLWCLISGGEPLLREDFSEIYISLKKFGLLLSLYTNGTLISAEHIKLLKEYPPRLIEITVYGVTKETYGNVTGKPHMFDAFLRGLRLLQSNNIPFRLKAVALRSNIHEIHEIADFCRNYSKDYFRFDPLLHLRYDGNEKRNMLIRAERLSAQEIARIDHEDSARSHALQASHATLIKEENRSCDCNSLFTCGAGVDSFSLGYDGMFRLCSSLQGEQYSYDLKAGTLSHAWNVWRPEIRNRKLEDIQVLNKCQRCSIYNLCLWCPAHAYLETGSSEGFSDYFCQVAKARQRSLRDKLERNNAAEKTGKLKKDS